MHNKTPNRMSLIANVALCFLSVLFLPVTVTKAQQTTNQAAIDDSKVRPPVTKTDLDIVKRARAILDSPAKWNRADNRVCSPGAKTVSLYCALQIATTEITGKPDHRGAALQETRFVVDDIVSDRNYSHRLMDYNNDPTTTFDDIQEVLSIAERLIALRLKGERSNAPAQRP